MMKKFLTDFLDCFMGIFVIALWVVGLFGPIALATTISPWFGLGYFVTIPLMYASIHCFLNRLGF